MNEELSTDDLKDVAGGSWTLEDNTFKKENPQWAVDVKCDVGAKGDLKTGDLLGKKGKKNTNYDCQDLSGNP